MHARELKCAFCDQRFPLGVRYDCPACGGTLDVVYDYQAALASGPFDAPADRSAGLWRYRALLPIETDVEPVTLGEGGTALLAADRLADKIGHAPLFLKNETTNPTLSFKDRPISVGLTAARQFGASAVVTASTGNTGVAVAAYAARAGLPCDIYVPAGTAAEKLAFMRACGANLREVAGTFSDAYARAAEAAARTGAFNLTSTFLNPFAIEGDKTLAYEIFAQLGRVPDWVVIPIGAGPLLVGCLKGFEELRLAGLTDRLPRMVGVQAAGCAPIVRAFERGCEEVTAWDRPSTVAGGIADPLAGYPRDGVRTLRAIRDSGGLAVAVDDAAILECVALLARREGVVAEPAAACSVAAARAMARSGKLEAGQAVVCVVTGHGVKDLAAVGQGGMNEG